MDPWSFGVSVKDGVASISGHVDRMSTAQMVADAVAAVPGIVEVKASIAWSVDDRKIQPSPVDAGLVYPFGPR